MKRIAVMSLCLALLMSLCACANEDGKTHTEASQATQPAAENTMHAYVAVKEDEFPELLQGGLTKAQFANLLRIAPDDYSGLALSARTVENMCMAIAISHEALGVQSPGYDDSGRVLLSLTDINRVLSMFTDCRITEENHPDQVHGDSLAVLTAGGLRDSVTIRSAEHNGTQMRVEFNYQYSGLGPDPDEAEERIAILKRNENGFYQITDIGAAEDIKMLELMMPDDSPAWKHACWKLVFGAQDETFVAPSGSLHTSENPVITYRLCDLNANGVPELVLQVTSSQEGNNILSFRNSWVGIYTFDNGEPQRVHTNVYYMPRMAWDENTQSLIIYSVDAFNGHATYYALGLENGQLTEERIFDGQFGSLDGDSAYNDEHGYAVLPGSPADDFSTIVNY